MQMKPMATREFNSYCYTRITNDNIVIKRVRGFFSWEIAANLARYANITGNLIIEHVEEWKSEEKHSDSRYIEHIHRVFFIGKQNQLQGYVCGSPIESSKKENQYYKRLFKRRNPKRINAAM